MRFYSLFPGLFKSGTYTVNLYECNTRLLLLATACVMTQLTMYVTKFMSHRLFPSVTRQSESATAAARSFVLSSTNCR